MTEKDIISYIRTEGCMMTSRKISETPDELMDIRFQDKVKLAEANWISR